MGALPALIVHITGPRPRGPGTTTTSRRAVWPISAGSASTTLGGTVEVLVALTHATLAIRREPHYKRGPIGADACKPGALGWLFTRKYGG
jgi:hypothetical protein